MKKKEFEGALVLCPPSAIGSLWLRNFDPFLFELLGVDGITGSAKEKRSRQRLCTFRSRRLGRLNMHKGNGAEKVFVTHGYSEVFAHWLSETGIEAKAVKTQFEGELREIAKSAILIRMSKVNGECGMNDFRNLFTDLDQTTKTLDKIDALVEYFDKVKTRINFGLSQFFPTEGPGVPLVHHFGLGVELSGLPSWLFEESYHVVGDLAETITLVLPPPSEIG